MPGGNQHGFSDGDGVNDTSTAADHSHTVGSASPTAISNMQPSIGVNYLIKTAISLSSAQTNLRRNIKSNGSQVNCSYFIDTWQNEKKSRSFCTTTKITAQTKYHGSNGLYSFELKSVGLMWDEDIATICMGLLHEERPVLALECLQLQLTQTVAIGNSNVTSNGTTSSSSAGSSNSNCN
jgi:hypothetical protein